MVYIQVASIILGLIFIYYGAQCLYSLEMKTEFKRFGLLNYQRKLTGILQLLGALGLFIGIFELWVGTLASGGLGVLMLLGFLVRLKIKDSFFQALPSFIFMILNFIVCLAYLNQFDFASN